MYNKAIYPGTFDPVTNGHLDIIKRACKIFDEIIVAVADNKDKNTMFSLEKRVKMMKKATENLPKIKVKSFNSLLVEFAKKENAKIIIRGLRAVSDFEYELQMGYANKSLDEEIDTIYLMPNLQNAFISSSVVRSILKYNGDVSHLVPKEILGELNVYSN
ncbi:pantetheine-phosphate adenylyltransferase [Caminibacter mediatlanticus TB-2]|uniref:Phosphopantetheine adenylyltransferase n=1 Tax=Caminibacter mediatlanticus TB-2 TaxID=391592 RepID=A0ABX5V9D4_9BACT|nr:pantetheine-phosphate adenylyltransferase [Caminibacter mediatlanticus]QCT94900.1 pantetheine-phosphate adenylyltransferase [Caminibacter mediatlanticus TB-2]